MENEKLDAAQASPSLLGVRGQATAIVIVATTRSPIAIAWVRPWAVFTGNMKQAKTYCAELNRKAKNNYYEPVKVKTAAP